ncbi:probable disease resistance protein At1g58602 [Mercurialis annua]|uniref:probable disease resistance protein At1g58602 n=1 Tax=Mercurialis annua TaxID=3986 RepID=UPI0024AEDFBC|nr:probable disease resistance protein At1g58602 [Mercurialis annua]
MALAGAVLVLINKIQVILDDKELNNPSLRKQIVSAKEKLIHVSTLLAEAEAKQTAKPAINADKLETMLLPCVYSSDDIIDSFRIKTQLRRRKFYSRVRPFTQFLLLQSQSFNRFMKDFVQEIDTACAQCEKSSEGSIGDVRDGDFDQSKINGGELDLVDLSIPKEDTRQAAADEHRIDPHVEPPAKATESNSEQPEGAPGLKQPATEPSTQQPIAEPAAELSAAEQQAPEQLPSISDRLDDDLDFIGRKVQADELAQAVCNRHRLRFLISVVGAAGSGKTTFVRNIYNKTDVMQHFQLRVWVNVSEEFPEMVNPEDIEQKTKNLLIDILRAVTTIKDEEKLTLNKLEEKVRDFFISKRFLLVLDDAKTSAMFESIKRSFPNSLNGSRIVLISRDDELALEMNDQGLLSFHLQNLDTNESWALFLKKVGQTEGDGINDESLKQLIYDKCKGLPLAIVVLGGLLSTKEPSSWLKMVERLSFGDDPSKSILALAYQDLASELKPCLLYLGLFPKDYEIPVRRLFRLWAAEGLANPTLEGETPEVLVEKYLQNLIRRNMIDVSKWRPDGSPKRCRVPGVLYDNVFPNAAEIGFFHVIRRPHYDQNRYIRRVAAYFDISNPVFDHYVDNLRSYISFNTRKGDTPAYEIDLFINKITGKRGFGLLTVLDLENVYKPVLSETIGKLIHLSYLGLRWTFLDSIPNSVGDLPNLETLDVKHTNITSLPISIWSSKKLRHLYMNEIYLDVSLQKPLAGRSLANLLTLWGLVIGKKGLGEDWFKRLIRLTKLGLTCHFESLDQVTNWISESTNLRALKLRSIDEFSRPADLKLCSMKKHSVLSELYLLGKVSHPVDELQLPLSLKMVTLSVSQLENDPMKYLGELPRLKILRLFGRSYLGKEMTCHAKGFPELRVLKLWTLEKLENWSVEQGSMPLLKELEIRRCENMKITTGLQKLTNLKELTLTNMPNDVVAEIDKIMTATPGKKVAVIVNNFQFAPLPKN